MSVISKEQWDQYYADFNYDRRTVDKENKLLMEPNSKFINAAKEHSKNHMDHWLRYLDKVVQMDVQHIKPQEAIEILEKVALSPSQRVVFEASLMWGSPTHRMVSERNVYSPQTRSGKISRTYLKQQFPEIFKPNSIEGCI